MKVVIISKSADVSSTIDSSTLSIAPGESKIFSPGIVIARAAELGDKFDVILHDVSPDAGIIPDPDSRQSDTVLHLIVKRKCN